MKKKINQATVAKLIRERNQPEAKKALSKWLAPELVSEISEFMQGLSDDDKEFLFTLLPEEMVLTTFRILDLPLQKRIIKNLPYDQSAKLLNNLPPDDRTEFLSEIPGPAVKELIKVLSDEERQVTLRQLGYPEHSVGRLMTPDYVSIKPEWSVQEVLDFVRKHGKDKETINVLYVTNDAGELIDDIRIREFLFVEPNVKVSELIDHKFISLHAFDAEETAIGVFRKNDRVALPVTDDHGVLLGIVTIDDVLRLAEKEGTEDIHRIGGLDGLNEPYMNVPFLELMRKRSGWLVVLFLGEMLTATAMSYFEDEIAKAVVLALFVPLIISSGGNSGSQASTLIIRALALGEVTLKDWWRIMKREIFSGLFLGTVLGCIGFVRIAAWTIFTNIYGPHWLLVGCVVAFSLVGVVLWGTLSGSMLPMVLKRLGADPAVSSAPFVATLVDVTGLIIYFSIAMVFLRGTML